MRRLLGIFVVGALSAACDSGIVETRSEFRSTIAIDLSALDEYADAQSAITTVIAAVNLTVRPVEGTQSQFSSGLADGSEVRFDVTVPAGTVDFEADIVSNNGTLLYEGTTSAEIASDGFLVTIDMVSVDAMMLVTPDTADLRANGTATITVRNPGSRDLDWVSNAPCTNTLCVFSDPREGVLAPGGQQTVRVVGFSADEPELTSLFLTSNVGDIDLPVLTPAGAVGAPELTIDAITRTTTGVPVDPGNVSGSVDVDLSVDLPIGFASPSVEVRLGGATLCAEPLPTTGGLIDVTCTVNTAQFDVVAALASTSGSVNGRFPNGGTALVADLYTGTTLLATTSLDLVLNNSSFLAARVVPPTACLAPPAAPPWCAGDLAVDVGGVNFGGPAVSIASVTVTAIGNITAAVTDGSPPFRFVFAGTPGTPGGIAGMEHADVALTAAAVTNAGAPGPVCVVTIGPPDLNTDCQDRSGRFVLAQPLRIDNAPPRITRFDLTPATLGCPTAPACWINGAFQFEQRDGFFEFGDGGVGGATVRFDAGLPRQLRGVTSGADLAESQPAYVAAALVSDALENTAAFYASTNATQPTTLTFNAQRFGVDRTPPGVDVYGIADRSANPPDSLWFGEFYDTGLAPSRFGLRPALVHLRHIRPNSETCYVPDDPFTRTVVPCQTGTGALTAVLDDGFVRVDRAFVPGASEGYWQLAMAAIDRARNTSPVREAVTLIDETPPSVGAVAAPASIPGLSNVTFSAVVADNIDLTTVTPVQSFGLVRFEHPRTTIGSYGWDNGLTTSASASASIPGFVRAWEGTDLAGRVTGTVNLATEVGFAVRDAAGNSGSGNATITTAVLAGTGGVVPSLEAISPAVFSPANPGHGQFAQGVPTETNLCNSIQVCINPTSTTLSATMTGPSGTFANPFVRVDFYHNDPTTNRWVRIGTGTPSVTDNGITRTWRYSFNWTVTQTLSANGQPIFGQIVILAMGVHPSGSSVIATATLRAVSLLQQ